MGDPASADLTTPGQVVGEGGTGYLTGVSATAGGGSHTLALTSDGTVWTWGLNNAGQLGDGTTTTRKTPVPVSGLTGVIAVAAGYEHSLALKGDGTVWAWGHNSYGQLGDDTTTHRPRPVQVSGLTGVTAIAGGDRFSLAVKGDGTAWAWGDNRWGQLGDGTTTERHTPVQVSGLSNVTRIDGGYHHTLALSTSPGPGSSQTTSYGYDRLSRLTSASVTGGSSTSYSYDPVGNRLSRVRGGTTTSYAYDRADRITSAGGVHYTVNAAGNLTGRGSDSFGYDQAHRLTSATVSGTTSQYTYDGDGKRVSQTVGSSTTRYVYDINAGLPVLLDDGSRKYVWGLGLAYAVDSGGSVAVYHTDGVGSVRALTDAGGQVTATYQTDEFGVPTQTTGSSGQPFGYTGEQQDRATGLVYLRARMYDPATGRFLQRDPWPGVIDDPLSLHRYSYVENNPANSIDPSGLPFSRATKDPYLCQRLPKDAIEWLVFRDCERRAEEEERQKALEVCLYSAISLICVKSNILLSSPFRELGRNLRRAGFPGGPGMHAHHIVAFTHAAAAGAQAIMQRHGINLNSAVNGVWLPARYHLALHTTRYFEEVERRLVQADTSGGGVVAVLNALNVIRHELIAGTFPYR